MIIYAEKTVAYYATILKLISYFLAYNLAGCHEIYFYRNILMTGIVEEHSLKNFKVVH